MHPDTYDINVSVNDQYITLKWVRRASEQVADMLAFYPELQLEFRYDDISFDTVKAMLKDLHVPAPVQHAIMTRVNANAS